MFAKTILLAAAISLLGIGSTFAQQTGTPKPAQPTKTTHVGRDICATHPNLPQCS